MNHDLARRLAARTPGHALERAFYTDPAIYAADLQAIWYRDWLFAIPACELAGPGAWVTHQVGDYRIILLRGQDGVIRAFHNTCRHRGSILCKGASGQAPRLVCPYHQWIYDLDGRLLRARDMGEDFDPAAHGLRPVQCRTLAGLVYICLAEQAPDFDAFADLARPYLAVHDLDNARIAHSSTIIERGNWKLVWENNRECYHCRANHPALCRTFSDDPVVTGIEEGVTPPRLMAHFDRLEAAGLPARFHLAASGQ